MTPGVLVGFRVGPHDLVEGDADLDKPGNVLKYINKPIVWMSRDADVTSIIAERLKHRKDSPAKSDE